MSESTITLESLERLAADLEFGEEQRRERLLRLTAAYARILAVRQPELFDRRAVEYSDEDGYWDNSYPPKQQYKDRTGPRLIKVSSADWQQVATSEGFDYSWRATASELGLYVARDGEIWGGEYSGEGAFGRFAAHPGDHNVQLSIDWSPRDLDEVSTADLVMVEETLRDLAFPLVAAARAEMQAAQ